MTHVETRAIAGIIELHDRIVGAVCLTPAAAVEIGGLLVKQKARA